jgi:hypothetical protein
MAAEGRKEGGCDDGGKGTHGVVIDTIMTKMKSK